MKDRKSILLLIGTISVAFLGAFCFVGYSRTFYVDRATGSQKIVKEVFFPFGVKGIKKLSLHKRVLHVETPLQYFLLERYYGSDSPTHEWNKVSGEVRNILGISKS